MKKLLSIIVISVMLFSVFVPAAMADSNIIIIDNTDYGFSLGGTWTTSTTLSGYYGINYRSDGTSTADSSDVWAKWEFSVPTDGCYGVYMRWTADTNRPNEAPVEISYSGGIDSSKTVNQTANGGQWVLISTYEFEEGEDYYVKLYSTDAGYTVADAIMISEMQGYYHDVGVISTGSHQLPSIICSQNDFLTIVAQDRCVTTVPGGHFEKGPADIVAFTSANGGDTWSSASYIFNHNLAGPVNVCGYSSVLVYDGGTLRCLYTVGPENWSTSQLTVYETVSNDYGVTWSTPTMPTIISDHENGLPTNGGKGYRHPNGRLIVPGRKCLLYSDDSGATWTATPQFANHVETKVVPYYINGNISLTAIVGWRTGASTQGINSRIRIADFYSNNGTYTSSYGSDNNFGLCRYDQNTILMTVARNQKLYIRVSYDEGRTWTNEKAIMGSAPSARYSDIAVLSDGTIVVVFMENEVDAANGANLRIVKFNMDWILSP